MLQAKIDETSILYSNCIPKTVGKMLTSVAQESKQNTLKKNPENIQKFLTTMCVEQLHLLYYRGHTSQKHMKKSPYAKDDACWQI